MELIAVHIADDEKEEAVVAPTDVTGHKRVTRRRKKRREHGESYTCIRNDCVICLLMCGRGPSFFLPLVSV